MKTAVLRSFSMLLAVFLVFGAFASFAVFAEDDEVFGEGEMNLDVVFVLDESGSMATSDPNKIAPDAFNLFVDLVDDSCGAGYVVYSHQIISSHDIVSFDDKKSLEGMKKKISALGNNPKGDTDIALGLTKAKDIFDKQKTTAGRKRAIILLSDGNTHLVSGPRTEAESKKELNSTLKELAEDGIPVYSVGLNCDGTLDKKEIEKISEQTNGKSFETKTSDKLPSILSGIFADIYSIKGTDLKIVDGNVEFKVDNSSVFYVNIIIQSRFTLKQLNPTLKNPKNKTISLKDEDVKVTSTGSYTLIKLIYPMAGKWNMHLDNATAENCKITQMDFYSVFVKQTVDKNVRPGGKMTVSATLNDSRSVIQDFDLLSTISMIAYIREKNDPVTAFYKMKKGAKGVYSVDIDIKKAGEYTVYTVAKNDRFEKTSNYEVVAVNDIVEESVIPVETSVPEVNADDGMAVLVKMITYILIGVVIVGLIIGVIFIVIGVLRAKKEREEEEERRRNAPPPPPPPQPETPKPRPTPQPQPQPKAPEPAPEPEYVDIPLVEHGSLESLIKRGSDDTFNKKAEDFQTDTDLEKIIKKGSDDAFNASSDQYQVDPALAALIKTGGDTGLMKEEPKPEDEEE